MDNGGHQVMKDYTKYSKTWSYTHIIIHSNNNYLQVNLLALKPNNFVLYTKKDPIPTFKNPPNMLYFPNHIGNAIREVILPLDSFIIRKHTHSHTEYTRDQASSQVAPTNYSVLKT